MKSIINYIFRKSSLYRTLAKEIDIKNDLIERLRKDSRYWGDKVTELTLSIEKNKHMKKRNFIVPTEAVRERMRKGKVCSVCAKELKNT